jgi:CubicO group peptidase (beta-lactamase class C family)
MTALGDERSGVTMKRILFSLLVVWACPGIAAAQTPAGPPPTAAAKPAPEKLAADTPRTTAAGTTFTAPREWSITVDGATVVLLAPDGDSRIAIVESSATEPDAAVAAAWESVRPGVTRALRLTTPAPGRDGWDEQRNYSYETSPNERRAVGATALRRGTTWTVWLVDGAQATFDQRGAQIGLARQSLRPKGYTEESFAGRKAHPLDPARVKQLTDFVENAMQELSVPGVGLAIVDNGTVVFDGGFGVRELGKPEKVDAGTTFMIASNTKSLTTLLMATLVDEGKLDWDTPVTKVYPAFKLGDAATTQQVLVRHLLCACTGLPRQDYEWLLEFKTATPASVMRTLGGMQPTTKFGDLFQYSNLMAAAAGYVAGHAVSPGKELGAAYDEAMQARVFGPLGMKTATFDIAQAERGNHARPHGNDADGKVVVASMDFNRSIFPARPAGAAWTSAGDLLKFVQMELARGKLPNGRVLVSEKNLLARRAKQVAVGETGAYGMGLSINTKWNVTVLSHGGSMLGYKSDMIMLPEHNVGAVILTNGDTGAMMLGPFRRRLLEVLFDGKPEAVDNLLTSARQWKANVAKNRERLTIPADPAAAARLAARYHNTVLGSITVKAVNGATVFDFDEWKSTVASRKNDDGTLSFVTIDPPGGFEFVVAGNTLVLRDSQHEYVFTPESASTPSSADARH